MRIAVTTAGPTLDSEMDSRFGRCPFFLIAETDDLSFEAIDNSNQALGQGAGIQSARLLAEHGVKYVLTGNCGPNAHQTLTEAGIGVVAGCSGTAREMVEQFAAGQMQVSESPNVAGHHGMGPGTDAAAAAPPTPPPAGSGRGGGGGMGRGRRGGGGGMRRGRGGGGGCGGR